MRIDCNCPIKPKNTANKSSLSIVIVVTYNKLADKFNAIQKDTHAFVTPVFALGVVEKRPQFQVVLLVRLGKGGE
jgi:hypothetical protein